MNEEIEPQENIVQSACRHEAGHLVIGLHFGFNVQGTRIIINDQNIPHGGTEIQPWQSDISDFAVLEDYLYRRCKVILAGVIAESMSNNGDYDEAKAAELWTSGGGVPDHTAYKALVHVLRNILHPFTTDEKEAGDQLKAINHSVLQSAIMLVKNNIDVIDTIGLALASQVKKLNVLYQISIDEIRLLPGCSNLGLGKSKPPKDSEIAAKFFETAVTNYLSSRTLFLNQTSETILFDAGVLAHEALEKIMKALLYFHEPQESLNGIHNLNALRILIEQKLGIVLVNYQDAFEYYEQCYAYRYPDKQKPSSHSTGTIYVKYLDTIFIHLHSKYLESIVDEFIKYRIGIYGTCLKYYLYGGLNNHLSLLQLNNEVTLEDLQNVKDWWISQGYYVFNDKMEMRLPGGGVYQDATKLKKG